MRLSPIPLLLLAGAPVGQGEREFPVRQSSKHYEMQSTATEDQAHELLAFMELVHGTYTALLKPENKQEVEKRKFTLVLYRDMEEYLASGAPRGSGAYYNGRALVGFHDETLMKPIFAHEGMHQFTDATSKSFESFPFWFTEGIADCIGNCEVRNNKLYMCVKSGSIARMRLPVIQEAIRAERQYRLTEFLRLDRRRFMANADLCYAQAWSFCHFLITYPSEEDRSAQIPSGRFRRNLAMYYESMRTGTSGHQRSWEEAFKDIPLDVLEEAWKKYVLKLDGGKYLGIQGRDVSDEVADRLSVGRTFGAIQIEAVTTDGVAAKAGLRAGDTLLRFDGRRFPRGDAMNRLRIWMQEIPYGRPIKIAVVRDATEIEAYATWTKK